MNTEAMNCPERARLMAEHVRLKHLYATAVDLFFAIGYRATDADYKKLKNSIEEGRVQSEIAKRDLDRHRLSVHLKAG